MDVRMSAGMFAKFGNINIFHLTSLVIHNWYWTVNSWSTGTARYRHDLQVHDTSI